METIAEKTGIDQMNVGDTIQTGNRNLYMYAYHWVRLRDLDWKFKSKKDINGIYTLKRVC